MATEMPIEHTVSCVVWSMLRKVGHNGNGCFFRVLKILANTFYYICYLRQVEEINYILFKILFFF